MKEILVQDLAGANVHFGHKKSKWNPKMKKFIFAEKGGIHVINLEKTKDQLEKALKFLEVAAKEGKNMLFVGTKPQVSPILKDLSVKLHVPYVTNKWPAGLLTNWDSLRERIGKLKELRTDLESGDLEEKYTKKEVAKFKKDYEKLSSAFGGVELMRGLPDVMFVVDPLKEALAVKEANLCHIPVVAIVDTNASPEGVDYVIPANDDARKSLEYVLSYIATACERKVTAKTENVIKMTEVETEMAA